MQGFPRRLTAGLVVVLLLAGAALAVGPAGASTQAAGCPSPIRAQDHVVCGTLADGATYLMEVPPKWNGTLFLYSHGYVVPGSANPAVDVGDPLTGGWLLRHGYALAGSSYAITGWAIASALKDQLSTLTRFGSLVGKPTRVIAWGHSLGGIITAGLVQDDPNRFSAALPMCGVLAGGVAVWNTALDAAFAFQQLLDPSVAVTSIQNPLGNLKNADDALTAAQSTPQGRARIALGAALADTPGWYQPLSPEPAASDSKAEEANQYKWDLNVDFPFAFALRAQLESLAGGNPSWTAGVDFSKQLANSVDDAEVRALYKAAGLNLTADLHKLSAAHQIKSDAAAVKYLAADISFDGKISIPVLTMHTIGDGLVVPENERAYASVVARSGNASLLREVFVKRAGHCAFTPAETITSVRVLLARLATGRWDQSSLAPDAMNSAATALGASYNVFSSGSTLVHVPPAFTPYRPAPFLRPFTLPAATRR